MNAGPFPLAEVTRSGLTECIHHGHVVVTDPDGRILHAVGDPHVRTYMRSAAKPIQAMAVVRSGAADAFALTDTELAVICSSHYGEPFHVQAVQGILAKTGLSFADLRCGRATSLSPDYALQLARQGVDPAPQYNDCSGKHAGMLAACVHHGYSRGDYLDPDHPLQRENRRNLAAVSGLPEAEIGIGVDGCSAPVFALPLAAMARAYARLAVPATLPPELGATVPRIWRAMTMHPEMIAGTGGFCTELMRHTGGKLLGKLGAEGVYCIAVRPQGVGLALKIADGNARAIPPVALRVLEALDALTVMERKVLAPFAVRQNVNDAGTVVGEIRPAFRLRWGQPGPLDPGGAPRSPRQRPFVR
ncbi:MAG: asparaginase [Acidobacteria bacterium]|nr:asparaginase [Acidobacteriota bacterium]